MRKFGVKTFSSEEFLDYFADRVDFFEVQAIRGNDYSFLKKYDKEIIIHCEHSGFGINLCDPDKMKENLDAINFAKEVADLCGAKKIIIHPGHLEDDYCEVEDSIKFLKENCDSRFLVENMPYMSEEGFIFYGSTIEDMEEIIKETGLGICFDVDHLISSCLARNVDYIEEVKLFNDLKPSHYHICGYDLEENIDHLHFKDSTFDLKEIFEMIRSGSFTLEVPYQDKEEIFRDLEFVENL